ncbi:hypothetical protein EXT48_05795 [Pseudoalteromonas sp. CO348]|uniref:hypothetical protein n=1 Tax=Pseudoalteromonas sp. CO348 TaxID=1777271 RepID=UPI001022C19E|nr:hypothetical protein [Pseudoalteromonas sp. CO348]RZG07836.1 hypothetical protein EXT48_05795 [Pseudoalteromonas sp. CO348]
MKRNSIKALLYGALIASGMGISVSANAAITQYQTEICYLCSAGNAIDFAKKYPPTVECKINGPFGWDYTQECYSQPRDVLIINANSGQKWYYQLNHTNQGKFRNELILNTTEKNLPADANNLADELLRYYAAWDRAVSKVSAEYQSKSVQSNLLIQALKSRISVASESPNNCENEPVTRAANFAYNITAKANLRRSLASALEQEYGSIKGSFETTQMTALSYSVSRGAAALSGSWQYVPINRSTRVNFHDPANGNHTIVYNVLPGPRGVGLDIELNEAMSFLGGHAIKDLRTSRPPSVSNCMLEVLNQHLEASIAGGGGGGHDPVNLGKGYDRIPGRGFGGISGPQTCTWTYYDPWGKPYFSMEGACP